MSQITPDFIDQMLTHCARKEHPPLTVWEAEQLARARLDKAIDEVLDNPKASE